MPDSLLTAVSGLQAHQTMLDVVGNDLANVNTIGFKSQDVLFQDLFYQSLGQATQNTTGQNSTDPTQIGLGVAVGGVSSNFNPGSLETTGKNTDMALTGNGFFVINNGSQDLYT